MTQTVPNFNSLTHLSSLLWFSPNTPDANPYGVSLALYNALSIESNGVIKLNTGPNISSLHNYEESGTSEKMVGSTKYPLFPHLLPPVTKFNFSLFIPISI